MWHTICLIHFSQLLTTYPKGKTMKTTSTLPSSFRWLNAAQFLGAFNDNLFKLLVIFKIISLQGSDRVVSITALAGTVFVLPFILFAPLAGILADRFPKHRILFFAKISEIAIMAAGSACFYFESTSGLYFVLFFMALQSTVIGPAKLGILPEMTGTDALSRANSLLTMTSYCAVITGTITAALLSAVTSANYALSSLFCIAVSIPGALFMSRVSSGENSNISEAADSTGSFRTAISYIVSTPSLFCAMAGAALFLYIGAFTQLTIIPFGMQILSLSREHSSYLFLPAALGIGAGALLVGRLSQHTPNLTLTAVGSIGMTIFCAILCSSAATVPLAVLAMFTLGISGGLFIVPVNTMIQKIAPQQIRGRILALSYAANFIMVLAAALTLGAIDKTTVSVSHYFLIPAGTALILLIGAVIAVPRRIIHSIVSFVIRFLYRFRVIHSKHLPVQGPAIIVFNHVSWIDGLIAMASVKQPMHFLMKRSLFEASPIRPLLSLTGIIPVSYADGPHTLHHSLAKAKTVLERGGTVALFPEGAISRDGFIHRCRNGYRKLAEQTGASIVPGYIDGAWGSAFSYYRGKLFSTVRLFPRRKITVTFGHPLPADTAPEALRSAIEECGAEGMTLDRDPQTTLARSFVTSARKRWFRQAMSDSTGKRLSFGNTLIAANCLAELLKKQFPGQPAIGIMLPASAGGALVNIAAVLAGKIPVNLNFTASGDMTNSAMRQSRLSVIITSSTFENTIKLPQTTVPYVYIEQLLKTISTRVKLRAVLKALLLPARYYGKGTHAHTDDCATILFSSGSTGQPKGIMLSHTNILANTSSMHQAIATDKNDAICAALPFFHSFGFTATIWFPLLYGFRVVYHPNPLDGSAIASLVESNRATILLATPTFLKNYIRKATPTAFSSLRIVITGAEKLKNHLADSFRAKFGITPLEGYGATELSPVAALNVPDTASPERSFTGNKRGTIGRALPGVTAKTVSIDTGNPCLPGESGILFVKGANVMTGYIGDRKRTTDVVGNGWYNTGDIAHIDRDGFITLTDRLSRFSKIGGEMVPHGAIEDILNEAIGTETAAVAVTGVSDECKGEKLVVVYDEHCTTREEIEEIIRNANIPNLWKPNGDMITAANALPILGNGKLDLHAIRTVAEQYCGLRAAA